MCKIGFKKKKQKTFKVPSLGIYENRLFEMESTKSYISLKAAAQSSASMAA